jgi:hypothetical protein
MRNSEEAFKRQRSKVQHISSDPQMGRSAAARDGNVTVAWAKIVACAGKYEE